MNAESETKPYMQEVKFIWFILIKLCMDVKHTKFKQKKIKLYTNLYLIRQIGERRKTNFLDHTSFWKTAIMHWNIKALTFLLERTGRTKEEKHTCYTDQLKYRQIQKIKKYKRSSNLICHEHIGKPPCLPLIIMNKI